MNQKRLTTNGLTTPHLIYIVLSLGMIAVSVYLTTHFYEVHFPTGLAKGVSLCDFNQFWSCDKTTLSQFGSIFYVPTSFFGIVIGLIGIFGAIFPSESFEKTNKFFILLNALLCAFLFLYSLIALGGLCLMCSVYYLLSWLCTFMFIKYSSAKPIPEIKPLVLYGIIVIIPSFVMYNTFVDKLESQKSLSKQYVEQFKKLADRGEPLVESDYKIHMSTDTFASAPVRISLFSDFQCPFCKVVSDQMHELAKTFDGKINIQYFFYPLDNLCNPKVKRVFHQYACNAAFLAACDPSKFPKIHDAIFAGQDKLSEGQLKTWEKEFGLEGCMENDDIRAKVVDHIGYGEQYKVKSTPTIIVNGKKIETTVKTPHFKAIIKSIIEDENN